MIKMSLPWDRYFNKFCSYFFFFLLCRAASTATYPLQVIKARMQQRSDALELNAEGEIKAVRRNYSSMLDTARQMHAREGMSGFFKGMIPNTIRVIPGAAITFVVYEAVTDWLR